MSSPGFVGASAFLPHSRTLSSLRAAVQDCRGCELYRNATQAVLGEGAAGARIVLVGEQPGDEEDKQGRPFVGPAGKVLARALAEAGIDKQNAYVTNAVKHFKFEERGKRRIHKKPKASEVHACSPWLEAEISEIQPKVIVCLGATAAQAILGRAYRLTQHHGEFVDHPWAPYVTSTLHPSAVLRAPDDQQRKAAYRQLVSDLKKANQPLSAPQVRRAGGQRDRS
jgi:uracil-DNA glycosylase